MSATPDQPTPEPTDESAPQARHERRIAFERLRERTDELELLVSGLTVFALFSAPDLILSLWQRSQAHLDGVLRDVVLLGCQFGVGLCYALAFAFLFHIVVRAYWIGLIGLKSVFPNGIRWEQTRSLGPLAREYFRKRLPDLDSAIDGADRVASVVFAVAGLVAITTAWIAVLITVLIGATSLAIAALGLPDRWASWLALCFGLGISLLSIVNWLLDTRLSTKYPALRERPRFRRWLLRSIRISNAFLPQRLILPVQLTLQSNWHHRRFIVLLALVFGTVPLIGSMSLIVRQQFAPLGGYDFLVAADVQAGMRSAHYENLRGADDASLTVPMIPSDRVAEAWLRLFLPHLPGRDNTVLAARCGGASVEAAARVACAAGLWQVRLGDREVGTDAFVVTERRDLGLRGFLAYLPMDGLAPGRHDLEVTWNPQGPETGERRRRVYRIPFWLSPGYELSMP